MKASPVRFEKVLDPSDLWTVWDCVTQEPAMFGDAHILAGLSDVEASTACEILNDLYQDRQDGKQAAAA